MNPVFRRSLSALALSLIAATAGGIGPGTLRALRALPGPSRP